MKPSRTTNRLHFEDLDPKRFEDLALALLHPLHQWEDLRHYGRSGADDGIDIQALEKTESGDVKEWFIQCKRRQKLSASDARSVIDKALLTRKSIPQVMLLVVACDVSKKVDEVFRKYSMSKGIEKSLIWTSSILEAKLYSERKDLLLTYFGIAPRAEAKGRDREFGRNQRMKRLLKSSFAGKGIAYLNMLESKGLAHRGAEYEFLIRSVDDTSYPENSSTDAGPPSWFHIEYYDSNFNGIRVLTGIEYGIRGMNGSWRLLTRAERESIRESDCLKLYRLGLIPIKNIVDVDPDGDEHNPCCHIFCRFACGSSPFEGEEFVRIDKSFPAQLEPDLYDPNLELPKP